MGGWPSGGEEVALVASALEAESQGRSISCS